MQYIKEVDYHYISNKYHDTAKTFDGLKRFTRNDSLFDSSTGMDPEEIKKGLVKNDERYINDPHSIRKARAMEYVLDNTRIACDKRDIFPAVNCLDRPLVEHFDGKWAEEIYSSTDPAIHAECEMMSRTGAATLEPDYSHSVPVWDRVFALGFSGILREAVEAKEALRKTRALSAQEHAFYDSIEIVYQASIRFIGRLGDLAAKTPGSENMAEALKNIQNNPPASFYEEMLVAYLYFLISEHIDSVQARSIGHFDRLFYPYYQRDLARGISEETLKSQLAYFLMQFVAIGNYWGQPVYLGGTDAHGKTEINHLSYIFLDIYDSMGIYNPKIQIKYSDTTPKDFICKALDMIRRGHNSIVIVSEDHIRRSLRYNGVAEEHIVHADIKGCYEFLVQGGIDTEDYQINLMKPLEYALHGGKDGITGELVGLPCNNKYDTFEDLMTGYKKQLRYFIERAMKIVNYLESYMAEVNPLPLLAATIPTSIQRAKDPSIGGGTTNNTDMCLGAIANIGDSLTALKKYVYDRKLISLEEFVKALDCNYEGYEWLRKALTTDKDKFGNNRELPDSLTKEVVMFASDCLEGKPNAAQRGGKWYCGTHIARGVYVLAAKTLAGPDGRLTGEEFAKNMSPVMGQNHQGITAAILSVTKFDSVRIQLNALLDVALAPSAVKGQDGLEAMYGLVNTFVKKGGQAMQINVVNADDLRRAQKYPEQYKDLQIRVSGWNVLFNNINKEEQEGFIRQAEMASL